MNITPISFGKKYISKTNVIDNSTKDKVKMDFVEYEHNEKDAKEVEQAYLSWGKFENYIKRISYNLKKTTMENKQGENKKFFGLEDKNGNIQAICEIRSFDNPSLCSTLKHTNKPANVIVYFCTHPKSRYKEQEREYLKLGSALFNETLKNLRKDSKKDIVLEDASNGFWSFVPNMKSIYTPNSKVCYLSENMQEDTIKELDKKL